MNSETFAPSQVRIAIEIHKQLSVTDVSLILDITLFASIGQTNLLKLHYFLDSLTMLTVTFSGKGSFRDRLFSL